MSALKSRLSVAPNEEPVSYAEAAQHLRITDDLEKTTIEALITAARTLIEERTQRALITQTWTLKLDQWPCGSVVRLPRSRLIAVSSIAYVDADGVSQTWGAANYQVDASSEPGLVRLAAGVTWPTLQTQKVDAVTITYTAGYGAAATVPMPLRQAIKILVSTWFEFREAILAGTIVTPVPMTVDALIGPYRIMETY